jgi:hypothetical protein
MLSLVPAAAGQPPAESPRKVFWRVYLAWLAQASLDELAQLEQALVPHAHDVRPLVSAVTDALLSDPGSLPTALLVRLASSGWSASVLKAASAKAA